MTDDTDMTDDAGPISLTVGSRPANVRISMLRLEPGDAIDYRKVGWTGALVIVEQGELDIECASGVRARFAAGSVLTFDGLRLQRIRNSGDGRLVVRAISRDADA
jgi:hypothetical protein